MKYQLKPLAPITFAPSQEDMEKAVFVIARCLSLSGFNVCGIVYNQLSDKEKEMFEFEAEVEIEEEQYN